MSKSKLYERIADYLKTAIEKGELKIGEAIYSEPELCAKFNVSRTSVRKAIRQLAGENILVSRQGLGTFVKGNGHGYIHNAICMINHWTRKLRYDKNDTYYMDSIFAVEEECNRRDMIFQVFSGVISSKNEFLKQMRKRNIDGIVLDGDYQTYEENTDVFKDISPHIVLLNGNPAETKLPCILPDECDGFEKILALAEKHKKICFLHESISSNGRRRLAAFKKALKKYPAVEIIYADYSADTVPETFFNINHYPLTYQTLDAVFQKHDHINAVICNSDYSGVKTIKFLETKNLRVPEDVSVFGFNNIAFSIISSPALTTVNIDSAAMGRRSVEFLCDIIEGKTKDKVRYIPVSLISRDSHK